MLNRSGPMGRRRSNTFESTAGDHFDYEGFELIAWRMRVILPTSWARVTWDWVLITLVLYNLVSIPLEMCAVHLIVRHL